MTKRILPTPEELRQLLRYEPETGKLYWKPRDRECFSSDRAGKSWNTKYAGKEAFTSDDGKVYRGSVFDRSYLAHRIAWVIYYGEWPEGLVDHRNTDSLDNRIVNLREATQSENLKNRGRQVNNKSGYKGVYQRRDTGKWSASIWSEGIERKLGSRFATAEEAHAAYCEAAKKYHGEFARTE